MRDSTLLGLMWLASPALPVGGFSYSEGLEAAVAAGQVQNEAHCAAWLKQQLELTQVRSDWPALRDAHAAWTAHNAENSEAAHQLEALQTINAWVHASRESAEFLRQSCQMARSLLDWLRNGAAGDDPRIAAAASLQPAPTWPVVFALAAAQAGADRREALLAFGWSWAENLAQAAMKAVPLGQAAAQRLLVGLAAALPPAIDRVLAPASPAPLAFAPMAAILSAQHEDLYSRLFRS